MHFLFCGFSDNTCVDFDAATKIDVTHISRSYMQVLLRYNDLNTKILQNKNLLCRFLYCNSLLTKIPTSEAPGFKPKACGKNMKRMLKSSHKWKEPL
jgi:hypothetical protein